MTELLETLTAQPLKVWTTRTISEALWSSDDAAAIKKTERRLLDSGLAFKTLDEQSIRDEHERPAKRAVVAQVCEIARKKRHVLLTIAIHTIDSGSIALFANDARSGRRWTFIDSNSLDTTTLEAALHSLLDAEEKDVVLLPSGQLVAPCRELIRKWQSNTISNDSGNKLRVALEVYSHSRMDILAHTDDALRQLPTDKMSHLDRLEAESIHIIREVIAEADNPVMLYSVGKDSSVMLHLARKAFYPSPPPFPLLHVDTRWKFQAMYDFRDHMAQESGMDLFVHINPEAIEKDINPFDHGSALHTDITQTQGRKQALDQYQFAVAFGGARRDEEKSRE